MGGVLHVSMDQIAAVMPDAISDGLGVYFGDAVYVDDATPQQAYQLLGEMRESLRPFLTAQQVGCEGSHMPAPQPCLCDNGCPDCTQYLTPSHLAAPDEFPGYGQPEDARADEVRSGWAIRVRGGWWVVDATQTLNGGSIDLRTAPGWDRFRPYQQVQVRRRLDAEGEALKVEDATHAARNGGA